MENIHVLPVSVLEFSNYFLEYHWPIVELACLIIEMYDRIIQKRNGADV